MRSCPSVAKMAERKEHAKSMVQDMVCNTDNKRCPGEIVTRDYKSSNADQSSYFRCLEPCIIRI